MEQDGKRRQQESYGTWNQRRRRCGYNSQSQKDERLKVILDTNILISATYWFGNPKYVFDLALAGQIRVFTTQKLLEEYKASIIRDFAETSEGAEEKVKVILSVSGIVEPKEKVFICEDKDDNKVIEAALEAKADYIISGDKHLLRLIEFRGIRIVPAQEFIETIASNKV